MDHVTEIKAACAAAVAVLTALWGWFGWLVVLLVACMVADYLTGSAAAASRGEWSSKMARSGIWHKVACVVVVCVAGAADLLIGTIIAHIPGVTLPFEYTLLICPVVVVWYILTELGSIVENAVNLGAPCPAWLGKLLEIIRDAVDTAGEMGQKGDKGE